MSSSNQSPNYSWQFAKAKKFKEQKFQEIQSIMNKNAAPVNIGNFLRLFKDEEDNEILEVETYPISDFTEDDNTVNCSVIFSNDEVMEFENSIASSFFSKETDLDCDPEVSDLYPLKDENDSKKFFEINNSKKESSKETESNSLLSLTVKLLSSSDYHSEKSIFRDFISKHYSSSFNFDIFNHQYNPSHNQHREKFKNFMIHKRYNHIECDSIFIKTFRNKGFKNIYLKEKFKDKRILDLKIFIEKTFPYIFNVLNLYYYKNDDPIFIEAVVHYLFFSYTYKFNGKIFIYDDFIYLPQCLRLNNSFSFIPICINYCSLDYYDLILNISMKGLKLLARNDSLIAGIQIYLDKFGKFKFKYQIDKNFDLKFVGIK